MTTASPCDAAQHNPAVGLHTLHGRTQGRGVRTVVEHLPRVRREHCRNVPGKDPTKIEQLKKLETEKMKTVRDFLRKLKDTQEDGATLLDRTTVFFSSNLADASTHGVKNMPVLLAGGGFKHGQHLAFDPKNNLPLCNLFVSMLQRLGLEVDKFGSGAGTLKGLEMAG